MDLNVVVQQMRLDKLAIDASAVLRESGVPHVLIKGPTTALWLYSPPRAYSDVDLLVPLNMIRTAAAALRRGGIARPAGRVGEHASHSLLMKTSAGFEIDLHMTLPMMLAPYGKGDRDRFWRILQCHIVPFTLGQTTLPALDECGRLVVLSLHALGNGPYHDRSQEDLRRAVSVVSSHVRTDAAGLANRLGALPLYQAGLALVGEGPMPRDLPTYARLRLEGNTGYSFRLAQLAEAPKRHWFGFLFRELFPSARFMRDSHPLGDASWGQLVLGYMRRLCSFVAALPSELKRWWRAAPHQ